jgi:hypothetical protein
MKIYRHKLNQTNKICYCIIFKKNLKIISQWKQMATLGDAKTSKNEQFEFHCNSCDYKCCKKYNLDRHKLSWKHIQLTKGDKGDAKTSKSEQNEQKYCCQFCDKEYTSRNGLWKHKKKCNSHKINEQNITDKDLIMMLIKENSEFRKDQTDIKEMILEIVKNNANNTNNNNNIINTNSHNKVFNLNLFLNETCKNAMNITDFVDSIKLQLNDLINVGEVGYVEGISKIIVKNLNNLNETERPIHCTDKKRETMYIKDEGQWEKDDDKRTKLRKAVKKVANKNIKLLPTFREKFPDYSNSNSRTSDKYDKMMVEVMTSDIEKDEKIIKNISKATIIEKLT